MSAAAAGSQEEQGFIETEDGLRLFSRWLSPGAPRSTIVLVHGLAEHSGRYTALMSHLAARGHGVLAFDHRGHGRSPGRRVHVGGFDDFVRDVRAARQSAAARHRGTPSFVIGHSQGGLVAVRSLLQDPSGVRGVVLSSPLLGIHPTTAPSAALRISGAVLSRLWPTCLFPNHVDPDALSTDPAVGHAYAADPLVSRRVSARWFASLQRAIDDAQSAASRWTLPGRVMIGTEDRVVDPEATRRFCARVAPGILELREWPGLRHEIFNERKRSLVFDAASAWIDSALGNGGGRSADS